MGIYSYELYKFYDVENIIRIGTCGSYKNEIGVQEVILAKKSYSKSTYAKILSNYQEEIIESSVELDDKIIKTAQEQNINLHQGTILCSDVFYAGNAEYERPLQNDCLAAEMESFALFSNAKLLNKNASCILTVSNMLPPAENKEELTPEQRQTSLNKMITLGLETLCK